MTNVAPEHIEPCRNFVHDCMDFYEDDKPLKRAASLFTSRVGVGLGFGIAGIPGWPFNREGSLSVGRNIGVDFGTWGAGYSNQRGISPFWTRGHSLGANWYEGKYGFTRNWGVPILPFASFNKGVVVSGGTFVARSRSTCPPTRSTSASQSPCARAGAWATSSARARASASTGCAAMLAGAMVSGHRVSAHHT